MVLTPEQRYTGLLGGESPVDTAYNLAARWVASDHLHARLSRALPVGLTARSPNRGHFNPGFRIDVGDAATLSKTFGVRSLSLIVASDRMSNRVGDGVNASERREPQCFEIALQESSGGLSYAHPMTGGDCLASFNVDRPDEAVAWLAELRDHGASPPPSPPSKAAEEPPFFALTHPLQRDEVVCLFGLAGRTDLNRRLGRALGRAKWTGGGEREGIEMLCGMERIWLRRTNLQLVPNSEALGDLCERHPSVPDEDRIEAGLLFPVEKTRD